MKGKTTPRWLEWAREIQALGQTGLTFCEDDYNRQRYQRLLEIAAEIVEGHTQLEQGQILTNFSLQPGYATPKIDVRGAVIREKRILLVQERSDSRWAMPGGWADIGESPAEMVAREVWEESGFTVEPRTVIGVYDANRNGRPLSFYHAYKIVFECELLGGEARASSETSAADFFSFEDLPPLSRERTDMRHLEDVFEHLENPDSTVVFD
jgi:ADP-ribose pyrophosphatase YjhB (NUDIX family)